MSTEEKTDCCPSTPDCGCGTSPNETQVCCDPAARIGGRGRLIVFVVVIGAAVLVLAHGLLKKSGAPAGADQGPLAVEGTGETAGAGGVTLGSIASLRDKTVGLDAAFILLPGKDEPRAQRAGETMTGTIETLRTRGRRVAAFTLNESDADHARLVEKLGVNSLPSIVALGNSECGPKAVSAEITEANLIRAFVAASTPPMPCSPGSCE